MSNDAPKPIPIIDDTLIDIRTSYKTTLFVLLGVIKHLEKFTNTPKNIKKIKKIKEQIGEMINE